MEETLEDPREEVRMYCIRRKDGDADIIFHGLSTHSFWTWRLSHYPEITLVAIVGGAWF